MKGSQKVNLVAITGGSGAGKTWLADRMQRVLGANRAGRISLDDFYFDRSHLPVSRRAAVNFDKPDAIEWPLFERVLRDCRAGGRVFLPAYDFRTHCRTEERVRCGIRPVMLVDGLWLLNRPAVRRMFDLKIFVECPEWVRLQRRIARDVTERGRTPQSSESQFNATVGPMNHRYVTPQMAWADFVLHSPCTDADIENLLAAVGSSEAADAACGGTGIRSRAPEPSTANMEDRL